ncbi:Protein kinase-like domain [Pseudocohnilembus persalinus]|uniref:Protein kinase-like domain n=1 Tax=Pseudocohnilembus persalinus TaxID=266149 RepID=A0A0V0R0T6_PSEPJ|nr:Protein kinase-like domain [Pseudocohnilembus persalinus]|eukprot:KRX08148.1 Protein kinase-like domain [Pseudocohnilembus persalinus]
MSASQRKCSLQLEMCKDDNLFVQAFSLLKTITQGSTAQISLVKNIETNELLIQKSYLEDSIQSGLPEREYKIMKQISEHANIVKLKEDLQKIQKQINEQKIKQKKSQQDDDNFEACLEFKDVQNSQNNQENQENQQKLKAVCIQNTVKTETLQHLHQNHSIAHRDIKLENILIDKNFQLKLADFGFAFEYKQKGDFRQIFEQKNQQKTEENQQNSQYQEQIQVGTAKYMAPELFGENSVVDLEKVDVFACGVTLFSMHMGFSPIMDWAREKDPLYKFFAQNKQEKFWNGFQRKLRIQIDPDFIDLIDRMLEYDSQKRISIEQIFRHPWVTSFEQGEVFKNEEKIIEQMKYRKTSFEEQGQAYV